MLIKFYLSGHIVTTYQYIQARDYFSLSWVKESCPFPSCSVFIFSLYSVAYYSVYVWKLRSNSIWNVIADIVFIFDLSVSVLVYFFPSFSMSSKQNKCCPGKTGKFCNKIMPYWDDHDICRVCRNFSCSRLSVCNTCAVWTDDM